MRAVSFWRATRVSPSTRLARCIVTRCAIAARQGSVRGANGNSHLLALSQTRALCDGGCTMPSLCLRPVELRTRFPGTMRIFKTLYNTQCEPDQRQQPSQDEHRARRSTQREGKHKEDTAGTQAQRLECIKRRLRAATRFGREKCVHP
jgi:hypothetical protein